LWLHADNELILPATDGHPVQRANDATEVKKELGLHRSQRYGWQSKARARRNQSELEQIFAAGNARLKRQ